MQSRPPTHGGHGKCKQDTLSNCSGRLPWTLWALHTQDSLFIPLRASPPAFRAVTPLQSCFPRPASPFRWQALRKHAPLTCSAVPMAQPGGWPTGNPTKGYGIACVSVETVGNPRRGAGGRICSISLLVLTGRGEGSQNPLFPSQLSQPLTCLTKETKMGWHLSQKCRITSILRH